MNVTFKHLRFFIAVADTGNFTRAAAHLNVAQPALSAYIRALETELRVKLFDRTTRRVELTPAGQEFLTSARRLVLDLEAAVQSTHDLADRKRGRIVIAAPSMMAAILLPEVIAEHRRTFPVINIHFLDTPANLVAHRVRAGEADWGIGTFLEDEPELIQTILVRDPIMAFCHSGSPLAKQRQVKWSQLERVPQIVLSGEFGVRILVEQNYDGAARYIRPTHEVKHIASAIMLAEAGEGVAILPSVPTLAWARSRSRKVVHKSLVDPVMRRNISVVRPRERALTPAAASLLNFLQQRIRSADLTKLVIGED